MRAHFADHQFERHWHDTFTIGVTHSGVQSFVAEGSLHHSTQQKIMCFNPGVAHDGKAGRAGGFGYSMAYIDSEVVARWAVDAGLGARNMYVDKPLISDDETATALSTAFAAIEEQGESLRAYTLISQAVVQLVSRHGARSSHNQALDKSPAWLGRVRDYMHAHFAQDVTVEQLSAVANVSRVHLTRAFTRARGIAPHAYLNTLRVNAAKDLMRSSSKALADVALEVGYADQSHFCRRFKGATGMAPSLWKDVLKS